MKTFNSKVLLVYFLIIVGVSLFQVDFLIAEERPMPISLLYLRSTDKDENSAMSGECSGDTSSIEIDCYFVQTIVRLKLEPEKLPEKIKGLKEEMQKEKKDFKKLYGDFCKDMNEKNKDEFEKKIEEFEKSAPQSSKNIHEMLSICKNPSYEKIFNFTRKIIEDETKTCLISSFTDFKPVHLKKIGPNKWLGTEGPSGLCNAVITYTLENDAKYPGLWTFTQIRSHMDQNELCKGFQVGKPSIYSWRNKPFELKCEFIEYGL